MNRFWFVVLEGVRGLGRAKLAAAATIVALAVALLLTGIFALAMFQVRFFLEGIRERVDIKIFLSYSITDDEIHALQQELNGVSWIDTVQYVSKEDAAKLFKKDFGEDVLEVAGHNPFPPSFTLGVRWQALETVSFDSLATALKILPNVTEVIYQDQIMRNLAKYRQLILHAGILIGTIVAIVAILLAGNTIRLSIYSKREIIALMEFVGATRTMIRLPFLIEGAIQGLSGGMCGAGLTLALFKVVVYFLPFSPPNELLLILGGLIIAGVILGVSGSFLGLRRFLT